MNFIEYETPEKLRGGYYTDPDIAEYLVRWVSETAPARVLEPSCGDGAFIRALAAAKPKRLREVVACEILESEVRKARAQATALPKGGHAQVFEEDFLGWALSRIGKSPEFDAVVGNPPFIRYQYMDAALQDRSEELMGLHVTLRMRAPPLVVVLGDEALQRMNPAALGPLLRRPGCVSLGLARACPAHLVAEWARASPIEFVPAAQLPIRVARACRLDGALLADEATPPSPRRSEEMGKALLVLQRTRDFRVKTWARSLGLSRHSLSRLCAATLGFTPEEIAWNHFDGYVRREILHGRNDEQIAFRLGLANGYALRRAYIGRGLPFPRT